MTFMDKTLILLDYCNRGWRLFPVIEKNKVPATPNGLKDASDKWEQVMEWHSHNPNYNWGLATGKIVVVDIDPKNGGTQDSIKELGLPDTLTVLTGSGGFHLYYLNTGLDIHNSASKLAKGVDIRGWGGYVILPPSIHPNGNSYKWLNDGDITPFPKHIREKLDEIKRATGGTGNRFTQPQLIENGARNDTLFRLACSLRNKNLLYESILAALEIENERRCKPPIDDDELKRIVESAMRYEVSEKENE